MYAYVLIQLDEPNEREIIEEFTTMPEVKEAHILFGEWDLILKIEIETPNDVASFVIEKVRSLDGVQLTSTLVVAE